MDLENYNNIDIVKRPKQDVQDKIDIKDEKKSRYLWYLREQKYLKEKIYYHKTREEVFEELQKNNVQEITRIISYDNCCFVQYKRRF